jgi:hypothetical protein
MDKTQTVRFWDQPITDQHKLSIFWDFSGGRDIYVRRELPHQQHVIHSAVYKHTSDSLTLTLALDLPQAQTTYHHQETARMHFLYLWLGHLEQLAGSGQPVAVPGTANVLILQHLWGNEREQHIDSYK